MAESTHSILKTEFLKGQITQNRKTHLQNLEQFYHYYNHERYPTEHFGFTPDEVLNGKIPNRHLFKTEIKQAQQGRIKTYQAFNACRFGRSCL